MMRRSAVAAAVLCMAVVFTFKAGAQQTPPPAGNTQGQGEGASLRQEIQSLQQQAQQIRSQLQQLQEQAKPLREQLRSIRGKIKDDREKLKGLREEHREGQGNRGQQQ